MSVDLEPEQAQQGECFPEWHAGRYGGCSARGCSGQGSGCRSAPSCSRDRRSKASLGVVMVSGRVSTTRPTQRCWACSFFLLKAVYFFQGGVLHRGSFRPGRVVPVEGPQCIGEGGLSVVDCFLQVFRGRCESLFVVQDAGFAVERARRSAACASMASPSLRARKSSAMNRLRYSGGNRPMCRRAR